MPDLFENTLNSSLIPTKVASEISGYNADYLARLCREEKIQGTQVGRSWFINRSSLESFVTAQEEKKRDRAEELSAARGKEYRRAQKPVMRAAFGVVAQAKEKIVNRIPSHETVTYSRPLAAAAVALMVVAGSAYASSNASFVSVLSLAPNALVDLAINSAPGLISNSAFRITDTSNAHTNLAAAENAASFVFALPSPSLHTASQGLALFSARATSHSIASVHSLTDASRVPLSQTSAGVVAQDRIATLSGIAHDPINSAIYAYVMSGLNVYDAGATLGDAYLHTITASADSALASAATTRDVLSFVPRASTAILDGYVTSVVAVSDAAPKTAGTVILAAYDAGNTTNAVAAASPSLALRAKNIVTYGMVDTSLAISQKVMNTEAALFTPAIRSGASFAALPLKAEDTMLGIAGYTASLIDGPEKAPVSTASLATASSTPDLALNQSSNQTANVISFVSFMPDSWQRGFVNLFHRAGTLAQALIASSFHSLATMLPGGTFMTSTLTVIPLSASQTLMLPVPAGSLTRTFSSSNTVANGSGSNSQGSITRPIQNIINNFYPQTIFGGSFDDAVLAIVRPYVQQSIDASLIGHNPGGNNNFNANGVSSNGATLKNVTIESGNGAFGTLSAGNFTAGSTTLGTTTVNGDLTVTGTLYFATSTLSGSGSNFNADLLDGLDSTYFLANSFSTSSADFWTTQRDFFSTTSANYWLTGKSTDNLAEGSSSLYYTDARSRAALSSVATGLTYTSSTGVFSLTPGYEIPLTASTTDWNTAYLNRITSASLPLSISGNAISISLSNGTTDGYLSGTDWNTFNNKISSTSLSSTATGLAYNSSTGVFSLTSGYIIPTTSSTTAWETFYQTPSSRITAGSNLSWVGNTLNGPTDSYIRGLFSASTPIAYDSSTGAFTFSTSSISGSGSNFNADLLDGFDSTYLLANSYSTTSADNWLTTKSTSNLLEGANLYYTDVRARGALSSSATGLSYNTGTGDFSLTAGYTIPLTASTTDWNTAYLNRITSATAPLSIVGNAISISQANTSTDGFLNSTDWNTFNGKISSTSLSAVYPLSYNSSTGVFATAFSTTTTNTFSALNTFNGGLTANTVSAGTLTIGSLSGILKATAGVVSAAISGTDYAPATSGSSLLYGNGAGGFSNATVSSPLSFSAGALSIAQANASTNGYLASTDWNTFNGKISSTSLSAVYPLSYNSSTGVFATAFGTTTSNTFGGTQTFTNAPVLGSLTGFLKATAGVLSTSLIDLSTDVTSTLPVSKGGTGITSYTPGDVLYADAGGLLTKLPIGAAGQVLKVQAGTVSWGVDQTVGGGGTDGIFATSSGKIYPLDTSNTVLVGTNATSTANSIFEVNGQAYVSTRLSIGTTSPSNLAVLDIAGNALVNGTGTFDQLIDGGLSANTLAYANGSKQLSSVTLGTGLTLVGGTLSVSTTTISGSGSNFNADLLDGQDGTYYLSRANHTGTQLAATISDFSSTARGLLTSSATGLTYTSGTGVFSLTAGYTIPLTASTTDWNTAYLNRITSASLPLSITGNALSISQANTSTNGYLSSTDWNTFNGKQAALTGTTGQFPYFSGTNTVTATSSLFLAANGNVGIGTTTPAKSLTVIGEGVGYLLAGSTGFGTGYTGISLNGSLNVNTYNFVGGTSQAHLWINRPTSGDIYFRENNADQVVIKSGGNVGIGTTTPTSKLDVYATATNYAAVFRGSGGTAVGIGSNGNGSFITGLATGDSATSGTANLSLNPFGANVGVGTTTPAFKFDVYSSAASVAGIFRGVGGAAVGIGSLTATSPFIQGYTNDSATAITNLILNPTGGNVGVGTSSPASILHLYSVDPILTIQNSRAAAVGNSSEIAFKGLLSTGADAFMGRITGIQQSLAGNTGDIAIKTYNGGALGEVARFTSAGNVGIGTTTPYAQLALGGGNLVLGAASAGGTPGDLYLPKLGTTAGSILAVDINGKVIATTTSFAAGTLTGSANQVAYYNASGVLGGTAGFSFDGTNLSVGGSITAIGQHIGIGGVGTAGTPSYTFTGDLTTGIFHPGANTIGFSTGGNERARIDGSGNFGIGSTSPYARLSVKGAGTTTGVNFQTTDSNNLPLFSVLDNGNISITGSITQSGTASSTFAGPITSPASTNLIIAPSSATQAVLINPYFASIKDQLLIATTTTAFGTPYSTVIGGQTYIDQLAINTYNNPTAKLSVTGTSAAGTSTAAYFTGVTGAPGRSLVSIDSLDNSVGRAAFSVTSASGAKPLLWVDSAGNVGIGTTTPSDKLDVAGNIRLTTASPVLGAYNVNGTTGLFGLSRKDDVSTASLQIASYGGIGFTTNLIGSSITPTSASSALWISTAGNVGIGTTSPYAKLSVAGDLALTGGIFDNNATRGTNGQLLQTTGTGIQWVSTSTLGFASGTSLGSANQVAYYNSSGVLGGTSGFTFDGTNFATPGTVTATSQFIGIGGNALAGTPAYSFASDLTTGIFHPAANTIGFSTGGNERARIDGSGNFGIGSTSPTNKLSISVASAANTDDGLTIDRNSGTTAFGFHLKANAAGTYRGALTGYRATGATSYEFLSFGIDVNGGNVGIGTTTPNTTLTLAAFGNNGINLGADTGTAANSSRFYLSNATTGQSAVLRNVASDFTISTNGTVGTDSGAERLRVTSAGNIGIGTTTPAYKFQIGSTGGTNSNTAALGGDVRIGNFGGGIAYLQARDDTGAGNNLSLQIRTQNNGGIVNAVLIDNLGNVGIGTTTPFAKLTVVGDVSITGGGIYDNNYTRGTNGQLLQTTGTGIQWVSTSTLGFASGTSLGSANQVAYYDASGVLGGTSGFTFDGTNFATPGTVTATSQFIGIGGNALAGTPAYSFASDLTTGIFHPAANTIGFSTGGNERARIDGSGNFGIGTTSPTARLTVRGGGNASTAVGQGAVQIGVSSVSSNAGVEIGVVALSGTNYSMLQGLSLATNGTSPLAINPFGGNTILNATGGNVGIGTTTPSSLLEVGAGTGTPVLTLNGGGSTGQGTYIRFNKAGITTAYLGIDSGINGGTSNDTTLYNSGSGIRFYAGAVERIRILSTGNVGIGTSSPVARLDVSTGGVASVPTAGNPSTQFQVTNVGQYGLLTGVLTNGTSYLQSQRVDGTATTYNLLLNPNGGNIGIGTTSPSAKLEVDGAVTTTGNFLTTPVLGLYSTNAAAVGTGATIALGGQTGNTTAQYPFAYIQGAKEIATAGHYGGYLALLTVSDGLNGETGSGNYERLRITSAGNVGIGTTTPSSLLNVWNTSSSVATTFGSNIPFRVTNGNALNSGLTVGIGFERANFSGQTKLSAAIQAVSGSNTAGVETADLQFGAIYTGVLAETMRLTGAGNLGIGTTTPTYRVDAQATSGSFIGRFGVASSSYPGVLLSADLNGGWVSNSNLDVNPGEGFYLQNTTNSIRLYTAGTQKAVLTSTGSLGIGTSTPYAKLSVAGDLALTGGIYDSTATRGKNGQILQTTGTGVQWVATSTLGFGTGSVTSIDASGGTTGLTFSGGPITTAGTLTLAGTLGVANGGTNATSFGTTNGVTYFDGTRLTTTSGFTFNGTNLAVPNAITATQFIGPVSDGASAPAFTWGTDLTTGIFHPGSNTIGFTTGGSEKLRITSAGNVGIGTTSPNTLLQVNVPSLATGLSTSNALRISSFGNTSTLLDLGLLNTGVGGAAYIQGNSVSNAAGNVYLNPYGGSVAVGTTTPSPLAVFTVVGTTGSPSAVFYSDPSGGRGIRVVTSDYNTGSNTGSGLATAFGAGTGNTYATLNVTNSGSSANGSLVLQSAGGNVGIGTTSPGALLSVAGTGYFTNSIGIGTSNTSGTLLTAAGSNGNVAITSTGDTIAYSRNSSNYIAANAGSSANLQLQTNGSTRLFIDGSGNVGIGNTPSHTLDVTGNATVSGYLRVGSNGTPTNTTAGDITGVRLSLGNGSLGAGQIGEFINASGVISDTSATVGFATFQGSLIPASDSSANYRSLSMSNLLNTSSNFTGAGSSGIDAGWFENRVTSAGSITQANGVVGFGLFVPTAATALGTVTETDAGLFQSVNAFGNALTSTISRAVGIRVVNAVPNTLTITGNAGIAIDPISGGTNNTALLLGTTNIPTGNFAIYNASGNYNYFAGNIGIATTTPNYRLDVNGTVAIEGSTSRLLINPFGAASDQTWTQYAGRAYTGYNGTTLNAVVQGISGKGIEFNVNNDTFGLGTAAIITTAGNFGIGTTTPTNLLTLGAGSQSVPALGFGDTATGFYRNASNQIAFSANGSPITSFSSTGIATPSIFNTTTGSNSQIKLTNNGTTITRNVADANVALTVTQSNAGSTGNILNLANSGGTVAVVTQAGFLGISTTTPFDMFTISGGNIRLAAVTAGQGIYADNGSSASLFSLTRQNTVATGDLSIGAFGGIGLTGGNSAYTGGVASGYGLYVSSTNNVGIGTTTPGYALDITGDANSTGKYRVSGTQVVYLPNQTNFTGSLFVGNGGQNSTHTTGTEGFYNTGVGINALNSNTTGAYNTANGYQALYSNTTGFNNTANGVQALILNTTGAYNTANGYQALYSNTTGAYNTANGYQALYSNTTGISNTANGYQALYSNTTGINNTANGFRALYLNTTGAYNTANGYQALILNTTGAYNTANGYQALYSNTTGFNNTANGVQALYLNTSATSSTAYGTNAGRGAAAYSNQGGTYIGYQAGYNLDTGSDYNTLLGYNAGYGITTGARNVLIGQSTLAASYNQVTTGSNNIAIGNDVAVASPTASNQLNIGNLIYGTGLSGTGATVSTGNIGIGTTTPLAADKLSVVGGNIRVTGSSAILGVTDTGSNNTFYLTNDGTTATLAYNKSGGHIILSPTAGNVGIGTTTPTLSKLTVSSGGTVPVTIDTTGASSDLIGFSSSGTNRGGIGYTSLGDTGMSIWSPGLSGVALLVNPSGNVGIGTTTITNVKLNVNGDIRTTIGSGGTITVYDTDFTRLGRAILGADVNGAYLDSTYSSGGVGDISLKSIGSTKLIVKASGNVGIGTTTPNAALDISNGNIALELGGDTSVFTRTDATTKIARVASAPYSNSATPTAVFGATNASATSQLSIGGGSGLLYAATQLDFFTAANNTTLTGTSRLTITSGGNVGIGTTTPSSKLEVSGGSIQLDNGYGISLRRNTGNATFQALYTPGGTDNLGITIPSSSSANNLTIFNTSATPLFTVTGAGNVGIGTTSPSQLLTVGNNNQFTVTSAGAVTSAGTILSQTYLQSGGTGAGIDGRLYALTAGGVTSVLLQANGSSYLNGGNVGIGTTTPSVKLSVSGTSGTTVAEIVSGVATDSYLNIGRSDVANIWSVGRNNFDSSFQIAYNSSNAGSVRTGNMLSILQNGNTGIGTTTPTFKLDVYNTAASNAAIFRGAGSSAVGIGSLTNTSPFLQGYTNDSATAVTNLILNPSGGNVGIGTSTPASIFHLYSVDPILTIQNSRAAAVGNLSEIAFKGLLSTGADAFMGRITGIQQSLGSNTGDIAIKTYNGGALGEVARFTAGGNVGIGTSTPFANLSIQGVTNQIALSNTTFGGNTFILRNGVKSLRDFDIYDTKNSTSMLYISDGNVLGQGQVMIGTSTNNIPSNNSRLFVYGGANGGNIDAMGDPTQSGGFGDAANIEAEGSDWGTVAGGTSSISIRYFGPNTPAGTTAGYANKRLGVLDFGNASTSIIMTGTDQVGANNPLIFAIGNVQKAVLDGSGYLGLGTTSPYARLSVAGDIALTGGIFDNNGTRGTNGQVLQTTSTGVQWVSTSTLGFSGGSGVTSVDASGGTTGFSFTGGPITSSGTLTLSGTLGVANGGTNNTSFTTNGVAYYDGTKLTTGSAFTFNGTNVGIGSSSPFAKLALTATGNGTGTAFQITNASGAAKLTVLDNGNIAIGGASSTPGYLFTAQDSAAPAYGNIAIMKSQGTGADPFVGQTVGVGLGFFYGTGLVGSMYVDNGGNFKIGAKPSGVPMYLGFTTTGLSGNTFAATTAGATFAPSFALDNTGGLESGIYNPGGYGSGTFGISTARTERLRVLANGNIGIGTATPTAALTVSTTSANYAGQTLLNVNSSTGANALTVLGNLNVGVGSTTPWAQLSVNSNGITGPSFAIGSSTGTKFIVTNGGNVGIGTTSPAAQLTTTGTVQFANFGAGTVQTDASGNITVSSDERLKDLNGSFSRGLADIQNLSPILYHWNTLSGLDKSTQYAGFSAQNVQTAIPEAVNSDPRGFLTLQDRPILAASVNAIKELAGRTDTLATSTNTFSGQLQTLTTAFAQSQSAAGLPHALSATEISANSLSIAQGISAGALTAQSVTVEGTVSAARYIVPAEATVFTFGSTTMTAVLPDESFVTGSSTVDIYKLASYGVASVQALASRTDLLSVKIDDIETRLAAIEALNGTGIGANAQGVLGLAASTLNSVFASLGVVMHDGIAVFDRLVTHQLVLVKGSDGSSSTGSSVIPVGAVSLTVSNPLVHSSSKIFLTFTSSVDGAWYLSEKKEGSFTITLAKPQSMDTQFDYFLLQTDPTAQIAGAAGANQPPAGASEATSTPSTGSQTGGPTVSLNGSAAVQIPQGGVWTDQGATATAADGTSLTASIVVTGTVDTQTAGTYTITYTATDAAGVVGQVSRTVTVLAPSVGGSDSTVTAAPAPAPAPVGDSGTGAAPVSSAPDPTPAS